MAMVKVLDRATKNGTIAPGAPEATKKTGAGRRAQRCTPVHEEVFPLDFPGKSCILPDRARFYGTEGYRFESCQAY